MERVCPDTGEGFGAKLRRECILRSFVFTWKAVLMFVF